MEQLAARPEPAASPAEIDKSDGGLLRLAGTSLVRAVVAELEAGVAPPLIAARFHNGLAATTVAACQAVRDDTGLTRVARSGGVFQNLLLLERTVAALERA